MFTWNLKIQQKITILSNIIIAAICHFINVFDCQTVINLDFSGVIDYARELYFTPNTD